jgi:hypothetical protein
VADWQIDRIKLQELALAESRFHCLLYLTENKLADLAQQGGNSNGQRILRETPLAEVNTRISRLGQLKIEKSTGGKQTIFSANPALKSLVDRMFALLEDLGKIRGVLIDNPIANAKDIASWRNESETLIGEFAQLTGEKPLEGEKDGNLSQDYANVQDLLFQTLHFSLLTEFYFSRKFSTRGKYKEWMHIIHAIRNWINKVLAGQITSQRSRDESVNRVFKAIPVLRRKNTEAAEEFARALVASEASMKQAGNILARLLG